MGASPTLLSERLETEMEREVPPVNTDAVMAVVVVRAMASVMPGLMTHVVPVRIPLIWVAIMELRTVVMVVVIGWVRPVARVAPTAVAVVSHC